MSFSLFLIIFRTFKTCFIFIFSGNCWSTTFELQTNRKWLENINFEFNFSEFLASLDTIDYMNGDDVVLRIASIEKEKCVLQIVKFFYLNFF